MEKTAGHLPIQPTPEQYRSVFADILSQAVTGELVGMANFASMVGLYDDVQEKMSAIEHARSEKAHAEAFLRAGEQLGVQLIVDMKAPYWNRLRQAFLRRVEARDLLGCVLIQEVMLESFAISLYRAVAVAATGDLQRVFNVIATEEEAHLAHALEFLRGEQERDPGGFETFVHGVHEDVMTTLSEMIAKEDSVHHCGLCNGDCVKSALPTVHLDVASLRGKALNFYLRTLDSMGLRGEATLEWIAQLPA